MVVGAIVWTGDMKNMDQLNMRFGRRTLRRWGNTVAEEAAGNEKVQAMTEKQVKRRLRLPPLIVERAVQQMKWQQKTPIEPSNHVHELAATFGTRKSDSSPSVVAVARPQTAARPFSRHEPEAAPGGGWTYRWRPSWPPGG